MYFDFHTHPSTKPLLAVHKVSKLPPDCWLTIEIQVVIFIDELPGLVGDRLDSQSSLEQMRDGKIGLTVLPLHALEIAFAKAAFMQTLKKVANVKPPYTFNKELVDKVATRKAGYKYFDLIKKEFDLLTKSLNDKFILIDKVPSSPLAPDKLHALLSIEGGHCFLSNENIDKFPQDDNSAIEKVIDRYNEFLALAKSKNGRVAYLTLTHIGRSPTCSQAFAFAMKKEKKITQNFLPKNYDPNAAITPLGWRMVKHSLSNGILIDIKHMSYRARCEYYKFVKEQHAKGNKIPIVGTHMGAAGIDFTTVRNMATTNRYGWKEMGKYWRRKRLKVRRYDGLAGSQFYPISLNLYDEEIRFIVNSGGLIGVSLDERIVGYKRYEHSEFDIDYMTEADFSWFTGEGYNNFRSTLPPTPKGDFVTKPGIPEYACIGGVKKHQIYYLANNILRFVYAGGPTAWKHLCIGSDFDGLVDSVEACKTAAQLPSLRKNLKKPLKDLILSVPAPGNTFHVKMKHLDEDLDSKLDDLFFNNGYEFLKKHFSGEPKSFYS